MAKLLPVPTAATRALAIVGPTPGISIKRCMSASALAKALTSVSIRFDPVVERGQLRHHV